MGREGTNLSFGVMEATGGLPCSLPLRLRSSWDEGDPIWAAQPLPCPGAVPAGPLGPGAWMELACVPPGPADVHFVWEKNGREPETCVLAQTHALPDGRAHVLSWLRDAVREGAEYRCSALSSAGSQTSRVRVAVLEPGKRPCPPGCAPGRGPHRCLPLGLGNDFQPGFRREDASPFSWLRPPHPPPPHSSWPPASGCGPYRRLSRGWPRPFLSF